MNERVRRLYDTASSLLEEGKYTEAFILAYTGLKLLKSEEALMGLWKDFISTGRLYEEDAQRAVDLLREALGIREEPVIEIELNEIDLGLLFVIIIAVVITVLSGDPFWQLPLWVNIISIPCIIGSLTILIERVIRKSRRVHSGEEKIEA